MASSKSPSYLSGQISKFQHFLSIISSSPELKGISSSEKSFLTEMVPSLKETVAAQSSFSEHPTCPEIAEKVRKSINEAESAISSAFNQFKTLKLVTINSPVTESNFQVVITESIRLLTLASDVLVLFRNNEGRETEEFGNIELKGHRTALKHSNVEIVARGLYSESLCYVSESNKSRLLESLSDSLNHLLGLRNLHSLGNRKYQVIEFVNKAQLILAQSSFSLYLGALQNSLALNGVDYFTIQEKPSTPLPSFLKILTMGQTTFELEVKKTGFPIFEVLSDLKASLKRQSKAQKENEQSAYTSLVQMLEKSTKLIFELDQNLLIVNQNQEIYRTLRNVIKPPMTFESLKYDTPISIHDLFEDEMQLKLCLEHFAKIQKRKHSVFQGFSSDTLEDISIFPISDSNGATNGYYIVFVSPYVQKWSKSFVEIEKMNEDSSILKISPKIPISTTIEECFQVLKSAYNVEFSDILRILAKKPVDKELANDPLYTNTIIAEILGASSSEESSLNRVADIIDKKELVLSGGNSPTLRVRSIVSDEGTTINKTITLEFLNTTLDLDFSPFGMESMESKLTFVAQYFQLIGAFEEFRIPTGKFSKFCKEVFYLYTYRENPFHNFYHALSVLHGTYYILATTELEKSLDKLSIFSMMLAGFCHDVDHPGLNNTFNSNAFSPLAIIYNDKSILENHHAATTFKLIKKESTNICEEMELQKFKTLRRNMIGAILATDLKEHFSLLSQFDLKRKSDNLKIDTNEDDRVLFQGMVVHTADLIGNAKSYEKAVEWSRRLRDEFVAQVKEEKALGVAITPYMVGLEKAKIFYKGEVGFFTFISMPLIKSVNEYFGGKLKKCEENAKSNIEEFQRNFEKAEEEEKNNE